MEQVTGAATATGVGVLTFAVVYLGNELSNYLIKYNKDEKDQILELQSIYIDNCFSLEKDNPLLSNRMSHLFNLLTP